MTLLMHAIEAQFKITMDTRGGLTASYSSHITAVIAIQTKKWFAKAFIEQICAMNDWNGSTLILGPR
jgi:hypothetical protein